MTPSRPRNPKKTLGWNQYTDNPARTTIQITAAIVGIVLTKGQLALVDTIDADLAEFNWCAGFEPRYANGGKHVALRTLSKVNGKPKTLRMHRVILERMLGRELARGEKCDHIDCNPLNCTRENLRLATSAQNVWNQSQRKDNTSGYKGVTWHKQRCKWQAYIQINGCQKFLGSFDTPEAAYAVYCEAAVKCFGEFAQLGNPLTLNVALGLPPLTTEELAEIPF